jgi:hypothetical protein
VRRILTSLLPWLLLLAACSAPPGGQAPGSPAPSAPPAESPAAEPSGEPAAEPPSGGVSSVTSFFVRDQSGRLWIEPAVVELDAPTRAPAQAAVQALLRGDVRAPGLSTPANPATRVLGASLEEGVLTVDLSGDVRAPAAGAEAEAAFAQQLAHAVAQFDGIDAVRLWVDGGPVGDLWGHLDWAEPIAPDPLALSPVVISSPAWGAAVPTGALTVEGEANTFEATVGLRLIAPDGTVAEETFTTATCGTGCRGTWSREFTLPSAGRWTVEATEDDPSGGEGRPPFTARVEVDAR